MLCAEQEASTNGLQKSKVLEALHKASLKMGYYRDLTVSLETVELIYMASS